MTAISPPSIASNSATTAPSEVPGATAATLAYHAISLWVPAIWGTIAFILLQKAKGQPVVLRRPPE
jgi:uncharacterized membrane protein YbhN (UPF0104 family)